MKKTLALIVIMAVCFSVLNTNVYAKVEKGNPAAGYYGDMIVLADDKRVTLKDGCTLLFLNGTLITDYEVITNGDNFLVPLRFISEELGASVEWIGATREVVVKKSGNEIVLKLDKDIAKVNGKEQILDCPVLLDKGLTYVPMSFITVYLDATAVYSRALSGEYTYYYDTHMPLSPENSIIRDFPNVIIDEKQNSDKAITKEEALIQAQKKCLEGLANFHGTLKENLKNANEPIDRLDGEIKSIEREINRMMYLGEVSRYHKFTIGPYDILFDKYNGKMFFVMYSSGIIVKPFDVNDKGLYSPVFIVG